MPPIIGPTDARSVKTVQIAADLSLNKSVEELKQINMVSIMEEVGQLPDTHLHCAQLAEITLQRSLENYLSGGPQKSAEGNTMS